MKITRVNSDSELRVRTAAVQFDRDKLLEAVWLLIARCPPDELGNVKLHKALYFADMLAYVDEGKPITGDEYLKQKFGPTSRHLTWAIRQLVSEGKIAVEERPYYGFYKKFYYASRPFQGTHLSDYESGLLSEMGDFVCGQSARQMSDLSHEYAWASAEMGEPLPYFTALRLLPEEITEADRQWACATALEHASSGLGQSPTI